MSSISSPELLTPPRPTSAAVRAREISEILVYSPPRARMPFSVKVVKGAALDDSSPLTAKCSPATSNPHKSSVFIPQKADPASRYPNCFLLDILGINRADGGRHCEEHATCGLSLKENLLIHIQREVFAFNKAGGRQGCQGGCVGSVHCRHECRPLSCWLPPLCLCEDRDTVQRRPVPGEYFFYREFYYDNTII